MSGAELPEKCRELALHFENQGTPIMIGEEEDILFTFLLYLLIIMVMHLKILPDVD